MRRIMALITAMILVCSGCGGRTERTEGTVPGVDLSAGSGWACWEGERLELQRRLVRWYGIHLESESPEPNFRESYENILAGPGGMMGAIHFPEAGITMPIFHDGWEGQGFVHRAASAFPAGEGGTAVLTLAENQPGAMKICQSLKTGSVFQIWILDRILTYRITEKLPDAPEEDGCVLEITREGEVLRLMGILEKE